MERYNKRDSVSGSRDTHFRRLLRTTTAIALTAALTISAFGPRASAEQDIISIINQSNTSNQNAPKPQNLSYQLLEEDNGPSTLIKDSLNYMNEFKEGLDQQYSTSLDYMRVGRGVYLRVDKKLLGDKIIGALELGDHYRNLGSIYSVDRTVSIASSLYINPFKNLGFGIEGEVEPGSRSGAHSRTVYEFVDLKLGAIRISGLEFCSKEEGLSNLGFEPTEHGLGLGMGFDFNWSTLNLGAREVNDSSGVFSGRAQKWIDTGADFRIPLGERASIGIRYNYDRSTAKVFDLDPAHPVPVNYQSTISITAQGSF